MHLYLCQHGDASPKSVDPNRPLSDKGRRDVNRLASFLARCQLPISGVVHSGKLRAQQTALIYSDVLGAGQLVHECAYAIAPNDPIAPLSDALLKSIDIEDNVMIVGHLPYLDKLVSQLVTGDEAMSCIQFEPGCVIALEQTADTALWKIQWIMRPSLMGG